MNHKTSFLTIALLLCAGLLSSGAIAQGGRLTKIDLSKKGLTSIPDSVFEHKDLEQLILAGNRLVRLPAEIGRLKKLKSLDLSANRLMSLPPQIGKLRELEKLNLSFNQLTALPPQIGRLRKLKQLDMRENRQFQELPPKASHLSSVMQTGEVVLLSPPDPISYPPPPPPPPPPSRTKEPREIFKIMENMPRFPGCERTRGDESQKRACTERKVLEFIYANLEYPEMAKAKKIEGTVKLSFIVEKDGTLSDVNVERGIGGGCNEEAVRMIHLMNAKGLRWTPGMQGGRAVISQYILSVPFKL